MESLSCAELVLLLASHSVDDSVLQVFTQNQVDGRAFCTLSYPDYQYYGIQDHYHSLQDIWHLHSATVLTSSPGFVSSPTLSSPQLSSSPLLASASQQQTASLPEDKPFGMLNTQELGNYLRAETPVSAAAIEILLAEEYDGTSFLELTDQDMERLGVKSGPRTTLRRVIQEIKERTTNSPTPRRVGSRPSSESTSPPPKKRKKEVQEKISVPPPNVQLEKMPLPSGKLDTWNQLISSGQLEKADVDVRRTFSYCPHTGFLCPHPDCTVATDLRNHFLAKHVGYPRFACGTCGTPLTQETQLRRHLREVHKLDKEQITQRMAPIFATLKSALEPFASPTDFDPNDLMTLGWLPQAGEGSPSLDVLIPEVGTNGTLIAISFANSKTFPEAQMVQFHCQNHLLPIIERRADIMDNKNATVPFIQQQCLETIRMAVFQVDVVGIEHSALKFIWVAPATLEALNYTKKTWGRPRESGGSEDDEDERKDFAKKINKLTQAEKDTLVHCYAFLGDKRSLATLRDQFQVDLTRPSPVTRENMLHVAIREEWPSLVQFAIDMKREMLDEKDLFGQSPRDLLALLPADDECKVVAIREEIASRGSKVLESKPTSKTPSTANSKEKGPVRMPQRQPVVSDVKGNGFYTASECNAMLKAGLTAFDSQTSFSNGKEAFVTSTSPEKSKEVVKKIVAFLGGSSDLPTLNLCMEFLLKLFYLDDEIKVQVALREYASEANTSFLSLVRGKPCDYTAPFMSMFSQYFNQHASLDSGKPTNAVGNLANLFMSQVRLSPASSPQLLEIWKETPPPRAVSAILFKLSLSLLDLKIRQVTKGNTEAFETVSKAHQEMRLKWNSLNGAMPTLVSGDTAQDLAVNLKKLQTQVQSQELQIKELKEKVNSRQQSVRPETEVDLSRTTISGEGHRMLKASANIATFAVNLVSSSNEIVPRSTQFLTVEIVSRNPKLTPKVIRDDAKGECRVAYEPCDPGLLTIKVQYKGMHIPGSPFRVYVPSGKPTITLANNGKPFGVVYARGLLYAVDIQNNKILEFPVSGPPKDFKSGLNSPRGLSVTPTGDLLLADGRNHRVIMMGPDGTIKLAVGSEGITDSQFKTPRFVLPLPDESFMVCDTDNSRLQFFSKTGQFQKKIGFEGHGPLEFRFPLGAAVNPLNPSEIAIADCNNHRVQFIHLTKGYVGEYGSTPAHIPDIKTLLNVSLASPNSVLYDKEGYLYVSELDGHCVKVFSPDNTLVKTLGRQGNGPLELSGPRSLAWSPDGALCVADHDNNRVVFF